MGYVISVFEKGLRAIDVRMLKVEKKGFLCNWGFGGGICRMGYVVGLGCVIWVLDIVLKLSSELF